MYEKQEIDAFWMMYQENCAHGRHHGVQRSTVAASMVVIAGALLGFATHDGLGTNDIPVLLMIAMLGVFGAFFAAKQYEKSRGHMRRAGFYRDAIDQNFSKQLEDLKNQADVENKKQFSFISKFELNHFWLALYLFISILSVILIAVATFPGSAPPAALGDGVVSPAPLQPIPSPIPAGQSEAASLWILPILLIVTFCLGWLLGRKREGGVALGGVAIGSSGVAAGVSFLATLTALGAAWVAVGKVDGAWIIVLPLIVVPAATMIAGALGGSSTIKWVILGLSFLGFLSISVAHLIDRNVAGQSSLWLSSFGQNVGARFGHFSFADYGAVFAALVAYYVALKGALGTGARRDSG